MIQRHKRRPELFDSEKQAMLETLGRCRKAVIDAGVHLHPLSQTYLLGLHVTTAIDDLAGELTGDPKFFHAGSSKARALGS